MWICWPFARPRIAYRAVPLPVAISRWESRMVPSEIPLELHNGGNHAVLRELRSSGRFGRDLL